MQSIHFSPSCQLHLRLGLWNCPDLCDFSVLSFSGTQRFLVSKENLLPSFHPRANSVHNQNLLGVYIQNSSM